VASAATIDFNVAKDRSQGALIYSSGSQSVSVEAFLYTNYVDGLPTLYGNPYLASWPGEAGLGICSGTVDAAGNCSEDEQVDGAGDNEIAVLDFGSLIVQLTSITFSNVERDDRYDVLIFGNGTAAAATEAQATILLPNDCSTCTVSDFVIGQGSIFGIGGFSANTEFRIKSVSFEVVPQVVPLPATGVLLIAGVGAIASLRRRKIP
jgi:hypothetical protein